MADDLDIFAAEIPEVDGDGLEELPVPEPSDDVFTAEIPSVADEPPVEATRVGTGSTWEDALLGLADGLTLGHGAELGRIGDDIGNMLADATQPVPAGKTVSGSSGTSDELYERAGNTTAGAAAKDLGRVGMGVLGGLAAGPGVLAQAGAGAALGGASAHGEDGENLLSWLAGAAGGGLLGGAVGVLGKGASALGARSAQNGWRGLTVADDIASKSGVNVGMLARPWEIPGRVAASLAPAAAKVPHGALRGIGGAAATGGGMAAGVIGDAVGPSKAHAQVAYGGEPTMSWAVQSVLTSGDSRLDPQDEQRLTEAVMSGDTQRVISANFALQQKNPAYAKRYQDEVMSLQEQDQ
jgi:hypothetical protein